MISAMIFAHIVGDFILQSNRMALWKSKTQLGVLFHGLIVLIITLSFALIVDAGWWGWALFVGLSHIFIDSANLAFSKRFHICNRGLGAMIRFSIDQLLHISIIILALIISGRLSIDLFWPTVVADFQEHRFTTLLIGYTFVMMPAWVLIKFLVYGLVNGSPPDFTAGTDKYVGIFERLLITTFVLFGQFILIPLVALPRLWLENRSGHSPSQINLYIAELLVSISVAVGTGLLLQLLLSNGG